MYAIYLKKYLERRISHSPNSQINAPLSYYIDHLSLAVRATLKLRRGLNASLPYGPPVSPWSAAVKERCCCCILYLAHEMFPKSAVLNLTPVEIREHLGSWWDQGVENVPRCQHFWHKRIQILGCLGTLALALWWCHRVEIPDVWEFWALQIQI